MHNHPYSSSKMDFFQDLQLLPKDPIFGQNEAFIADSRAEKVNLGVGVYKTESLQPFILSTVKKAEEALLAKERSKDYLPIDGSRDYLQDTQLLVFGSTLDQGRLYSAQTLGATGALMLGGHFLRKIGHTHLFLAQPTWENHPKIFTEAGFNIGEYRYLDKDKLAFDSEGFLKDLDQMPKGAVIVLQACCHNPTGVDPTPEQWEEIYVKIEERELFPFFDFAYQGFGDDLVADAAPLRLFLQKGKSFAAAISHSKNFGLYAERCGALFIACRDKNQADKVGSHIKSLIRSLYSNPPCHGARVVAEILSNPEWIVHWEQELTAMRARIRRMRLELFTRLQEGRPHRSFEFLSKQKGMFSYLGLKKEEVERLIAQFGIYPLYNGRINVAGLNASNLDYVANSILTVIG